MNRRRASIRCVRRPGRPGESLFLLATSLNSKAEGSKPEESQAEQPYTDQLGDNQVTSVKREITKDVGLSREELLRAAREAVPLTISPPATDTKPDEQR
jgi:hypothetical protein